MASSSSRDEEDWQAQVEELVALQAIYEESFVLRTRIGDGGAGDAAGGGGGGGSADAAEALQALLGAPRPPGVGNLAADVLVEPLLPAGGLRVTVAGHAVGGEPVRFLPPLRAAFELPPGYPSRAPPRVCVTAAWLRRPAQQRALEAGLLRVCEENGGCSGGRGSSSEGGSGGEGGGAPALYPCLDWLREAALAELGVTDALPLDGDGSAAAEANGAAEGAAAEATAAAACSSGGGDGGDGGSDAGGGKDGGDTAAGPCPPPPAAAAAEALAMQVLRYHAARAREEFDAAAHRCPVCLDDVLGSACAVLPGCRHFACRPCLATLAETHVREGAVDALRCPDVTCRQPLPPDVLRGLLDAAAFARWEALLLQRTLDRMHDLVYCPRCETPCLEDADKCAQCARCWYAFCSLCCSSWHPGSACVSEEQKALIAARRRARGGSGAKDTAAEMDLVQQLASLKVLRDTSRPCPACKAATEKAEGCNKITCAYCGAFWCWRCGEQVAGYDHFKAAPNGGGGNGGGGGCRLFEQEEIDRWNRLFGGGGGGFDDGGGNGGGNGGGRRVALGGPGQRARMCVCPSCGQATFQAQNRINLVRCWACAQHYCVACRALLRGGKPGAHYIGAGACKQHDG